MKLKKIIFIAKTNLNNDGRILNQIKILQNHFQKRLDIDFLLLPDKQFKDDLGEGVNINEINTIFRKNKYLRALTVVEFIIKALFKIIKLKPNIIHVQDLAAVLPVFIYKKHFNKEVVIIYDDHEMPNEKESVQYRIMQHYEKKIMKMSNHVIYANRERQEILNKTYKIKNSSYFLNLPYFETYDYNQLNVIDQVHNAKLSQLKELKENGYKIIIHQGQLEVERGRKKLAEFSKTNFINTKIAIIGISESDFQTFISEFNLKKDIFYFIGSVPYKILSEFWKLADTAIIMYLPTFINNRLCAPNRYYIALKYGIPTIVNRNNPVLFNFTESLKSGFYIEDIKNNADLEKVYNHTYNSDTLEKLKEAEIHKFISIYEKYT